MASEYKLSDDPELYHLLSELKDKTGIEFSIKEVHPNGLDETKKQLRSLLSSGNISRDKNDFLRKLMNGELPPSQIYDGIKQLHIDAAGPCLLYLAEFKQDSGTDAEYILKTLFHAPSSAYVVRMDELHIAVIKVLKNYQSEASGKKGSDPVPRETAQTIFDMLSSEAMLNVEVSYSVTPRKLQELSESYREASLALRIGEIFYAQEHIFACDHLGLARLIYGLPLDVCRNYLNEVFGDNAPEDFDEETVNIIHAFFENGLNISETARQLYLHRNTLVYRLEKISRATGLDIRNFDDAITYKIATMIREYLRYKDES